MKHAKLIQLRDALRQPMPERFIWCFDEVLTTKRNSITHQCDSLGCAIGLAMVTGLMDRANSLEAEADALGISVPTLLRIFYKKDAYYQCMSMEDVTPAMVADEIDRYLAARHPVADPMEEP